MYAPFSTGISGADEIRLVGGSDDSGRLEVLVDEEWGTVCNRRATFTQTDAQVACEQLEITEVADTVAYGNYLYFA